MARKRNPGEAIGHTVGAATNPAAVLGNQVGLFPILNAASQIGDEIGALVGAPGRVILSSTKPRLAVAMTLRSPVAPPVPRPKYGITDRPGTVGLTPWQGRDPYLLVLPVMFDSLALFGSGQAGSSVEDDIRTLEAMAVRHKGMSSPPVVTTIGPVPDPIGVTEPRWRITGFTEIPERTVFNDRGKRCRWAVDISLMEHVRDDQLDGSIDRSIEAVGLTKDVIETKPGDTDLYQLAKRIYGDRGKAREIARANGFNLSIKLKPGTHVNLP